jgi:hypothetical protein
VVDPHGGAVPGAAVTVTTAQGARSFTTDARGRFFAPYLSPGAASVRVELAGFKKVEREGLLVRLGQRLEVDFTLEVSAVRELVEVTASSPVIDLRSTTAGAVLDSDQLKALPVGRHFADTLYLVPGVSDSGMGGNANPSVGGASGLENSYQIDGVNVSSTGYGALGAYSLVFGSLGTGVTTDFIKETQVKAAGFEAEYGQATGGIVNVVTRSGTNRFHGSLFGYWSPHFLEPAWRQVETPNGHVNTTGLTNADFGIAGGGPILKDRLFAFAAFNPQYETRTFIAPDDAQSFPLRALGEVDRRRRSLSYAAKLTWQASGRHRFDLSLFGDPSHGAAGAQRPGSLLAQDTTRFSTLEVYGGHNQSLRYDGILSPGWFFEASFARSEFLFEEVPSVDEWRLVDRRVVPWVSSGGLGGYESGQPGRNLQYALKSTHLFTAAGTHQLRSGAQLDDIEYARINVTGPTFVLPDGTPSRSGAAVAVLPATEIPQGYFYSVGGARYGPPPRTTQRYASAFVQDAWQIGRSVTLKLGLRWERQTLVGGDPPLCFDDEVRVGDGGSGHGNPVRCAYTWSHNWSPRLGAIWDVGGSGRAKLFAHWGRFYVKIPNDLAARALSGDALVWQADYYDAALTQPIPEGELVGGRTRHFSGSALAPSLFANDTRSTFTDELLAGFEIEAAPLLNVGVRYVHRTLSTVLEDYAQASPVMWDMGFPGLDRVEYIIDNISADLETLDPTGVPGFEGVARPFFEDPVHTYDALEITATRAFAGSWSLLASYRWSRLRGNFEGFYRSDNGQSDPALTSLFDFPTNDPSYTEIGGPRFGYLGDIRYQGTTLGEGRLPNDRPHQIKVYGACGIGDLNLGIGLQMGSGRVLTAMAANPAYGAAYEIPMTLRGQGFQTVDGFETRTPFETVLSLHADYTLRFGESRRVMLIADAFDVFNAQDVLWYDYGVETGLRTPNPDFGYAVEYRPPRQIRVGARFEW